MAREATRSARFVKIIAPQTLFDGTVEIPANFVSKYKTDLVKCVILESSPLIWFKVELKHRDGRVWLHKGWQEFLHSHSIQSGYSLFFDYQGGSLFHVSVFDTNGSEIHHLDIAGDNGDHHTDNSSVEILDEWPHKTGQSSVADQSEVVQNNGIYTSRRGMDSQSRYMHFRVILEPACRYHLEIPECIVSGYLHGRRDGERTIHFDGPDGKCWSMDYSIGAPPMYQVSIGSEWGDFVREYNLQDGDECNFELVNRSVMAFNLTIFRVANRKAPESTALDRAKAMKTIWPSFISNFKLGTNKSHYIYMLSIPTAHAVRYLMDKNGDQLIIRMAGHVERTWSVKCYVRWYDKTRSLVARLSTGWKDFVAANDMRDGDACFFELLSMDPYKYQVTIVHGDESED